MKLYSVVIRQSDAPSLSREVESVKGESPSRESPLTALSEDGSGANEGSAEWMSMSAENDVGSGEAVTETGKKLNRGDFVGDMS